MIKTLVTIGPQSVEKGSIADFLPYTNLFRLNGSHNSLSWHGKAVDMIRRDCPQAFILMDIPGVKPRTSNNENIYIGKGQSVCFGVKQSKDGLCIGLTKSLPAYSTKITDFSVNDGQYLFDVTDTGKEFIIGESREEFILLPRKGLNLPGSVYDEEQQAGVYEDFIQSIADLDIDALGLSFVQGPDIIARLRIKRPDLLLISKVENSEGLRNCVQIAAASDAVMIDRGDLVAEIGYENLFSGVEEISHVTKSFGKPLIMATENLESMLGRDSPSKSEVISLSHSASIGVDCFMLSEETALSSNASVIVQWLCQFSEKTPIAKLVHLPKELGDTYKQEIWKSVQAYPELNALIMSKSGRALFNYISIHSNAKIFLITNSKKLKKLVSLYSNEIFVFLREMDSDTNLRFIQETIKINRKIIFQKSDKILAIYVSEYSNKPRANSLTIFHSDDF